MEEWSIGENEIMKKIKITPIILLSPAIILLFMWNIYSNAWTSFSPYLIIVFLVIIFWALLFDRFIASLPYRLRYLWLIELALIILIIILLF